VLEDATIGFDTDRFANRFDGTMTVTFFIGGNFVENRRGGILTTQRVVLNSWTRGEPLWAGIVF